MSKHRTAPAPVHWTIKVAFIFLCIAVAVALWRTEQNRQEDQHNLCLLSKRPWDAQALMINTMTEPLIVLPSQKDDAALVERVAARNVQLQSQRIKMNDVLGPRPNC